MKSFTLIISLLTFLVFSLSAQIIHVPANQPTIQAGINAAGNGDTVLVDEGRYFENIRFMGKAITVTSKYILDSNTSYINNTIIDGSQAQDPDSAATVMFINGEDTTSILNGFTITGGTGVFYSLYQVLSGGGVYASNSGSKIVNNKITKNHVDDNMAGGAGIMCWWNSVDTWTIIENNIISYNTSTANGQTAFGGGICVTTNAIIKNNIIHHNSCTNTGQFADGGGIEVDKQPGSNIIVNIYNNMIQHNEVNGTSTVWGAGISFMRASGTFNNNLIANNVVNTPTTGYGGGICIKNTSNIVIQNSTFANNTVNTTGGGIYVESATAELTNCIIWNNSPNELEGAFSISYSNIEGGGWPGTGNINIDPFFIGTGDHPYALHDDSPCVNTGIPDTTGLNLPAYDLAENPRIYGGRIEMGAYENQNMVVGIEAFSVACLAFDLQCFPNPFQSKTIILFTLPETTYVNLEIIDITGRIVKTLHSGFLQAEEHNFVWDAQGMKEGMYLLRLEMEGLSVSRKLLLLR